jgi:hypothetical protein
MSQKVVQIIPGETLSGPALNASGANQAAAFSAIAPDGDAFVCSRTRTIGRSRAGGIAIVITKAAVPQSDTPTTLKATLTVVGTDVDLCEPLVVCDFSVDPPVSPQAGHVLRLDAVQIDHVINPGEEVELIWNETGVLGDDGGTPTPVAGTRPEFLILGWPLVAVEPTSF